MTAQQTKTTKSMNRIYVLLALAALAIAGMIYLFRRPHYEGPQIGALAPDFVLEDRQQNKISLSSFRGKAVLLNFWATWCGPCQQEMPSIETLYQRYKEKGFVVVGVSLDTSAEKDKWLPIDEFLKQVPVTFPVFVDNDQTVSEEYQIFRVPETYFIDPEGKIVSKIVGPQNYNQKLFFDKVEQILPK